MSIGYGSPSVDEDTGEETTDNMVYSEFNKKMVILAIYLSGAIIAVFHFYCYYIINLYQIYKGDEEDTYDYTDSDDSWITKHI